MKIQTQSIRFNADQKLLELINERLEKLEQYYDNIIDAEVFLKLENTGQVQDKIVEVKLNVPKDKIVAKARSKKFEKSLDDAVEALKKQLLRYKGKISAH